MTATARWARHGTAATTGNPAQAPLARTVIFMLIGLFVAIWGIATLTT
jgi:hypothetical protein